MKSMDVAYLEKGLMSYRSSFPRPTLAADQVLIEVSLAGICATDLALLRGYASFEGVPGHEFVGRVVETGDQVESSWMNQRVVAEINQFCGHCQHCTAKRFNHCEHRQVIGIRDHQGAFAQYIAVKASTLHRLPETLEDQKAVFIEPLAAAYRIVEQLADVPYHNVLIIGAGKLGQLIARVMSHEACSVSVVTRRSKQDALLKGLPIQCLVEADVQPQAWDVVIEASGQQAGLNLALKAVRPCGRIILKSTYIDTSEWPLSSLVIHEVSLIGSRCGPFPKAISALQAGLNPLPLIDGEYPLNEIQDAIAHAARSGAMKILLRP